MRNPGLPTLFCALLLATSAFSACARRAKSPGLVDPSVLGLRRGAQFVRVQTHFHSPYSFDACDSHGLDGDGNPDAACLQHLKDALCTNHIHLAFLTDHAEHMAEYEFSRLVQASGGDTVITNATSEAIANRLGCADGFAAMFTPGLEGRMLALGMERHVTGTVAQRKAVYGGDNAAEATQIVTETGALIGIPHTESRELANITSIRAVTPTFIEIYNVHANTDPKIRKSSLGLPPFEHIAKFLNYLIDPFNSLNPDFFFMEWFEQAPVYLQKWNALLAAGTEVAGVGGLDSHENVFSQKAADGERLDSHRRMTRVMSNLVLTTDAGATPAGIGAVKAAIADGHSYFVLEGLGTPEGLDFYGTVGGVPVEMGLAVPPMVGAQSSSVVAVVPTVHASSLFMKYDQGPYVWGELHFVAPGTGEETVVARAGAGETITYSDPPTGHYRLHVYMVPRQTLGYVFDPKYAARIYPWVISNPVRVVR